MSEALQYPKFAKTDREHRSSVHILLEEYFESDHEINSDYENYSSNSKEEEEDNLNANGKRKRVSLLTNSDDNNEGNYEKENIEAVSDGTVGRKIETGSPHGRLPLHSIFNGISHPGGHSKINIIKGEAVNAGPSSRQEVEVWLSSQSWLGSRADKL
uniref:Uncharacterized protein n=1 Tax=Glossina austeni TaxID=7395 RepID=A0A1A9VCF4_GLOAU